jgi:autotransporter-associated beta strand protein
VRFTTWPGAAYSGLGWGERGLAAGRGGFMQKNQIRLGRVALLCLSSSALALSPAMASSFSVGGGTITTTNNDGASDLTGTGGPFILGPNGSGTAGDVITITGVSITNTDNSVTGRAIDIGGLNPSTASYSVIAHGNTLQGSDNAGLWIGNNGGTISFDSTGGSANHVSGPLGIMVINSAAGGNVLVKTGADIITTTGAFAGDVLNGSANGTGTISIDSVGATLTGGGTHGIVAQTGSGAITIGGSNGGIASSINVANGYGIFVTSVSSVINVTVASSGAITALNGMWLQGGAVTVDSFGVLSATNNAMDATDAGSLAVTLEQGSATGGKILGSSGDDTVKLVTGANIAAATFDGGSGTNLMNLSGSGTGTLDVSTAVNFSTIRKDGSGTWTLTRSGAAGISNAAVVLNAGTLVVDSSALSGNVASAAGSVLQFNQTVTGTYASVISGGAAVTKAGSGILILSGVNTYTGGTTVSAGTLRLGGSGVLSSAGVLNINGGTFDLNGFAQTVGTLSGSGGAIALGSGQLTTNSALDSVVSSVISGSGSIIKQGTGTLTLAANNSFTGATTVSAGRLNMTGSIAGSNISVASGATLSGTGRVGTANIASGGTLSPGSGSSGTLTVAGNLTLASGSTYVDNFGPSATSLTNASGTANLNGNLIANAAAGSYGIGQRYTLLTAAGGVSGAFSSFTVSGLSGAFRSALTYDANDVFLTLSPNPLSPLLPAGTSPNQRAIAAGIDRALQNGAVLPGGFAALFNLSGSALGGALNQMTGEIGLDAPQAAAQALKPFLDLLTRTGSDGIAVATGAPWNIKPAQLEVGAMRIWASAYGGHSIFGADAITGAQRLSAGAVGAAAGVETKFNDDLLIGVSLAGGSETFSLAGGQSQGISSDIMLGGYAREAVLDYGYLSGALVYGWHNVGTQRVITVSGTDILSGKFVADDFAGRVEGGYSLALDGQSALTPYLALAGDDYSSPAYGESARSGASTFALSYGERDSGRVHSELGARLGHNLNMGDDIVSAELHTAWVHQIQDDITGQASFENVAGASFAVSGVPMPQDSALLGLAMQVKSRSGVSGGVRVESQFGAGLSAVSGTVNIGYSW